MSHAALILNVTAPCADCGQSRGARFFLKCEACVARERPVTEADIERILREHDDPLS